MKNFLRISALLTATLMVFIMVGCGGGDEEGTKDTTKPTLASSTPASGGTMAANGTVTLVFSEKMGSATVNGSAAVNSGDGKTWNWTATGLAAGAATLKVGGADVAGNKLDDVSISVTVTAPDTTPPDIVAASCVPANGATGVDPATVTKMTIAFNEPMDAGIKVDAVEPTDLAKQITPELSADGKSLVISFLGGYKLSNEMTIKITLIGKDKAGNALKTTAYTFTTMKKAG